MTDDNKNIPPSAGEAAKAIVEEDRLATETTVQAVNRETYEDSKKFAMAEDVVSKKNTGWKIATVLLGIVAIGACGACVYMSLNEGTISTSNDKGRTKCDVSTENDIDDANKNETGDIAGSPNISRTDTGEYILTFLESGLSVNLGSNYEFINYSYSASAPAGDGWSERINIGGLSKRSDDAQDIPTYSRGRYEYNGGTAEKLEYEWAALAYLNVYNATFYDTNIQPMIDEADQNGGPVAYGDVIYRDDNYVVTFSHNQSIMSQSEWEQSWENETYETLKAAVTNTENWSK